MSRETRRIVLVAYDIVDDRRRERVAKVLSQHGDRVQYSVFLVEAGPARVLRLKAELIRVIELAEDSVMICDLGAVPLGYEAVDWLGRQRIVTEPSSMIV